MFQCEYYYCILNEMNVVGIKHTFKTFIFSMNTFQLSFEHPDEEKLEKWIKRNVIYNHAVKLLKRVEACDEELANATSKCDF